MAQKQHGTRDHIEERSREDPRSSTRGATPPTPQATSRKANSRASETTTEVATKTNTNIYFQNPTMENQGNKYTIKIALVVLTILIA